MVKLYVYGFVGNLGTKVLIEKKQEELTSQFNQEFIAHIRKQIEESLFEGGFNPSLIMPSCMGEFYEPDDYKVVDSEPIGKGGILSALWKLCDRNKWGLKYSLRKIPILQGTVEIANYFDINPYRLLTQNSYLIACEVDQNDSSDKYVCDGRHVECMDEFHEPQDRRGEFYEPLVEIGIITNEKKRVRIDGETEAFLTKDFKDEIDKIIEGYTKKNKW